MKSTITISSLLEALEHLPTSTSILLRGPHGIGKSQIVKKFASRKKLPLIDRRLSQMSEGDIIGLPLQHPTLETGTTFVPVDWFIQACNEPVVLFLDEINRATNELMQTAFQIVLDRSLSGWTLHPETRVFAAVNLSGNYNVNEIDPALLDRFWVADLEPSPKDWLLWAGENEIHQLITSFISEKPKFLDPPADYDPTSVQPTRRSWERLSEALKHLPDPSNLSLIYNISAGYIGLEAAMSFNDWVRNSNHSVTGEEIINGWKNAKNKVLKQSHTELLDSYLKVYDYVSTLNKLTKKQGEALAEFVTHLPGEIRISLWSKISALGEKKIDLIIAVHSYIGHLVMEVFDNNGETNAI